MTKITKIKEADNPRHPNNIPSGEEHIGILAGEPTVGYSVILYKGIGTGFRTSVVTEILSPNTFKTLNSIYKWEDVK